MFWPFGGGGVLTERNERWGNQLMPLVINTSCRVVHLEWPQEACYLHGKHCGDVGGAGGEVGLTMAPFNAPKTMPSIVIW